mgnify:CR=1 FL=1
MNVAGVDIGILAPAFVAGLLVAATHVPLGAQGLARGIVFIDLAVAPVAGLGGLFAPRLPPEARGWGVPVARACSST